MFCIEGNSGKWECVIGLEIHAQVTTKSKLFSSSATKFGANPNSQVSWVDAAMPGMLPVLNKEVIYKAIKSGIAINAHINQQSIFDRKNYFYPDLPQGYQISQFYLPIVQDGHLDIKTDDGNVKTIRIERIHLEQDAGKSIHDQSPEHTFIDLNRAGVPLMEIVTYPDISSPFEAGEYVKKLRKILRAIGTCDGNMDQGSMRCDINISVRKPGDDLGTRCEVKNVNSIKNIVKAAEYEAMRQVDLIEQGEKIIQETRLFDANTGKTKSMRSKENANDYRYFPDPDLLPVFVSDHEIDEIRQNMPELPEAKKQRYIDNYSLSEYDADILTQDKIVSDYFENVINNNHAPKTVANWICSSLFGLLNKASMSISECKITPNLLSGLLKQIANGTISGKIAKEIFEDMFATGKTAEMIIEEKGLKQISDTGEIEKFIDEILANNQDKLTEYKNGKEKLFGFFVGQVMKKTQGKANPKMVNDLLLQKINQ